MARHTFGGGISDWVFSIDGTTGDSLPVASTSILFYTALSGGTAITDLLDGSGTAETAVTTDSAGFLPGFSGPDTTPETRRMAADASGGAGPRYWVYANDMSADLDAIETNLAAIVPDATDSDILADGAQDAGSSGKLADASHVHPAAEIVHAIASATGAVALSLASGTVFDVTLTGNVTFTFTNPSSIPAGNSFTLYKKQDATGGRTTTWPGGVKWAGGTAPTLTTTANSVDVLVFQTPDGGTTWFGSLAGANFS